MLLSLILITFLVNVESSEFDYFVFAQQWPPAACLDVPHGKCSIATVVKDWSIHGLWPTNHKGYPSFCNSSWPFKPALIKPLIVQLEAKWPNIFADSTEVSFWKHEWVKHGTCATSLKQFSSEMKYFKNSIELHDRFNIYQFIRKAGIVPTDKHPQLLKVLENTINLSVNATVKLFCKTHKEYNYPILTSMYVCLDTQLNLIGCDEIHEPTCKNSYVYYLPFPNRTQEYNF